MPPPEMDTEAITREFTEAGALLRGHFILSSGRHSDTYLQCARVMMQPARAERLCQALAAKLHAADAQTADIVVAPAMGGVLVGYEMGRQLGLPSVFCERVNGAFSLRRSFTLEPGQQVLLVEDVVTTGVSSREAQACIEAYGARIVAEAALVDRSGGDHRLPFPLHALLTLHAPSYAPEALPEHLQAIPPQSLGSRHL